MKSVKIITNLDEEFYFKVEELSVRELSTSMKLVDGSRKAFVLRGLKSIYFNGENVIKKKMHWKASVGLSNDVFNTSFDVSL